MLAELPVGSTAVARVADLLGNVEHDRNGEHVVGSCQLDQSPAVLGAYIGGVDHGQAARLEAFGHDQAEHFEGGGRGRLVGLVVGDEGAAGIGRDDLGRPETAPREVDLPEPDGPIRTTREKSGMLRRIG